ncbi:DUF3331 domain-containing protein [uncultured Paraburkholderia sp.]|uniref:DUF3331 domain-containing protein n=1 Tax=uncultured Paraburkholderia sp. TaxID=1822466 RepID=UPI00338FB4A6
MISTLAATSNEDISAGGGLTVLASQTLENLHNTPDRSDVLVQYAHNSVVKLVERVTDRTVLVTWCDATSCRYADQLWTRRLARRASHCSLTGQLILRGDTVYGPSARTFQPPANAGAMILASSLE